MHGHATGRKEKPAFFVIVRRPDAGETAKTGIYFFPIGEHSTDIMLTLLSVNMQMNI